MDIGAHQMTTDDLLDQLIYAIVKARELEVRIAVQVRQDEVREICLIVHVGGTRCVTSSTGNIMNIQVRITLTVEVIRTCIFLF